MTDRTHRTLSLSPAGLAPNRRLLLSAGLGLAATAMLRPARAAGTIRIGYQKYGSLVLLKGRGTLEKALSRSAPRCRGRNSRPGRRSWRR